MGKSEKNYKELPWEKTILVARMRDYKKEINQLIRAFFKTELQYSEISIRQGNSIYSYFYIQGGYNLQLKLCFAIIYDRLLNKHIAFE